MSCDRESLLKNVTCVPGDTVTDLGLTPLDEIVMVGPVVPPPPPVDGAESEPHAATATNARSTIS